MTDVSLMSDDIPVVDELDEDDEVLAEPRFKYSRVLGHLVRLLDKDAASAFAIHDKFLAVGFQSGKICFFDHLGNESLIPSARYHKCAVSWISIDSAGNYFASCANDFIVNIFGIGCSDYNQRLSLSVPAKVVEISSDFSRSGSGQRFLVGSRDLFLYERGMRAGLFSGKSRESVLYKGLERDGLITAIAWNEQYVAFTNMTGTRIYHIKLGRSLTLVQPFHKIEQYPIANYPPKLVWLDSATLLIGWANTICVCAIQTGIRRYSNTSGPSFDLPVKHGQILHKFTIPDFFIAGVSFGAFNSEELYEQQPTIPAISSPNSLISPPLAQNPTTNHSQHSSEQAKWQELIVFGIRNSQNLSENASERISTNGSHPHEVQFAAQLLLLRPTTVQDYLLVAEDSIEMRGVDLKHLHRFTLCSLPADNIFFLMGAREVIEATPCSVDDRISWLLENGLFEDAFERAVHNSDSLQEHSILEVGKRLVNHLIERKEYGLAASYLPQVCTRHKVEWEFYVNEFERQHQILKLVPVIPTKEPQLEPECYESIVLAALYSRPKLFDAIMSNWSADIYRAHSIKDEIFKRITIDDRNKDLKRQGGGGNDPSVKLLGNADRGYIFHGLATLLLQLQDYDKAIKTYLYLGDEAIFGIINRHKLFSYIAKRKDETRIRQLMDINQDLTIRLLLDNEDLLPHDEVVRLLGHDPKIQMNYLERLQSRGEGANYSDRLVRLLADHKRPSLLPFLRKNEHYKLDVALDVCKKKDYVEEMVYLLGRSGNRLEALDLMMNKLRRIEMAIDFCAENGDIELWQRMIASAIKHPDHIVCLLSRTASANIDPLEIIEKIPKDMEIPGLQSCLMQVLRDYELQIRLLEYSKEIASTDTFELLEERLKPTPFVFDNADNGTEMNCEICSASLFGDLATPSGDVCLLANGRAVHEKCCGGQSSSEMDGEDLDKQKGDGGGMWH